MEEKLTYEQAYDELQKIAAEIEKGETPVDELALRLKRAAELLEYCQARLRSTEDEVERIVSRMNPEAGTA
jgi:exodeoxyribonuclease VII small subunit